MSSGSSWQEGLDEYASWSREIDVSAVISGVVAGYPRIPGPSPAMDFWSRQLSQQARKVGSMLATVSYVWQRHHRVSRRWGDGVKEWRLHQTRQEKHNQNQMSILRLMFLPVFFARFTIVIIHYKPRIAIAILDL